MLELKNIHITFHEGTPNEVRALQNLSLHIQTGDFVTVIGANGAGKSTLFNVIAGVTPVDSGHIFLDRVDVTHFPEYRRSRQIGRVFQNPLLGTSPNLSIRENLSLAALRGQRIGLGRGVKARNQALFLSHLENINLGLESRLDADVALLSGGQRQAITLLMATLMKPKILLLDEHTAALDPNAAKQVIDLTVRLAEEHQLTVIMITHSMQQACDVGNRVLMMNRGQILFDIAGAERTSLKPSDLIQRFENLNTGDVLEDRALL